MNVYNTGMFVYFVLLMMIGVSKGRQVRPASVAEQGNAGALCCVPTLSGLALDTVPPKNQS